jgi:hypothetical protein
LAAIFDRGEQPSSTSKVIIQPTRMSLLLAESPDMETICGSIVAEARVTTLLNGSCEIKKGHRLINNDLKL